MAHPVLDYFLLRGAMDASAAGSDRVDIDLDHCASWVQLRIYFLGNRISFRIPEFGQENGAAACIVVDVASGESVRIISRANLAGALDNDDFQRLIVDIGGASQDLQVLPGQRILIGVRVHVAVSNHHAGTYKASIEVRVSISDVLVLDAGQPDDLANTQQTA